MWAAIWLEFLQIRSSSFWQGEVQAHGVPPIPRLTQGVRARQVDYFGFLQLGSFYVLLGISCDYVFLYFDAYMQSLVEPLVAATLATRVSYMCQRATPVRPLRHAGRATQSQKGHRNASCRAAWHWQRTLRQSACADTCALANIHPQHAVW